MVVLEKMSARVAAAEAARMLRDGAELKDIWRHTVTQLLDDYQSIARHDGVMQAARLFVDVPEAAGDLRVDAAFHALAEHLARRDGWQPPAWSGDLSRTAMPWWFVSDLTGMHSRALRESPLSFRKRGVFITTDALERV
ncbi:MAG: hypothetical protein ACR2JX_08385 [Mycobacteriales bacterium]